MTYKNRNVLMPIRIGYDPIAFKIKFETPSYEKSTENEWVFDNLTTEDNKGLEWNTVSVLNPDIAYNGIPRGCRLFTFSKDISFIAYITSFKGSIPLFTWETIDFWGNREMFGLYNPKNISEVYSKVKTPYRHSVLYFIPYRTSSQWKSTTEFICIPDLDESESNEIFPNLMSCAASTFHKIKNKKVWVENSSQPLYDYVQWWNSLDQSKKEKSLNAQPSKQYSSSLKIIFALILFIVIIFSISQYFDLLKIFLIK